eukprot:SAG25_NODE_1842_length_2273_cov_3.134775_2_plen_135_part_00
MRPRDDGHAVVVAALVGGGATVECMYVCMYSTRVSEGSSNNQRVAGRSFRVVHPRWSESREWIAVNLTSPPRAGTMAAPAAAASATATATTAAAAVNPGAPAAIAATTPSALLPPEILVVLPPLPPLPRQVSTM